MISVYTPFRLAAVLILLTIPLAAAEDSAAYGFTVWGTGQIPCGKVTDVYRSGIDKAVAPIEQWVNGFITGMSVAHAITTQSAHVDLAEGKDQSGRMRWIESYCEANPLEPLHRAAFQLLDEISRNR